jgi:membrane protein
LATAVLWLALGLFSSLYFSSVIIDDSKTYGTIGVVFTFLSWFILTGGVIVLGAACGAAWQQRTTARDAED